MITRQAIRLRSRTASARPAIFTLRSPSWAAGTIIRLQRYTRLARIRHARLLGTAPGAVVPVRASGGCTGVLIAGGGRLVYAVLVLEVSRLLVGLALAKVARGGTPVNIAAVLAATYDESDGDDEEDHKGGDDDEAEHAGGGVGEVEAVGAVGEAEEDGEGREDAVDLGGEGPGDGGVGLEGDGGGGLGGGGGFAAVEAVA